MDNKRKEQVDPNFKSELAQQFEGDIFSQMVMGNLVHTSTVLLRWDRLQRVQGFDVGLKHSGEDYDFHLRTCREGPVAFIDLAAIQYQTGFRDQLTRPQYAIHTAKNFLSTISPVLAHDRDVARRKVLRERQPRRARRKSGEGVCVPLHRRS